MRLGQPPNLQGRAALVLAAALGLVQPSAADPASLAGAPRDVPSPLVRLSLDTQAGYDNDLLADPEGVGSLEPVSSWFATLAPVLDFRRAGVFSARRRDRCEAHVEVGFSGYSEEAVGTDTNGQGSVLYQYQLTSRSRVEGSGSFVRFRRGELPVYDVDLPEARLRLAHASGENWLLSGEAGYARPSYPGRSLDSGAHQQDDRFDVTASCLRSFSQAEYVALRASWREVESNDPYIVQHGPLFELRAGGRPAGVQLLASAAYSVRAYPDYPVLRSTMHGMVSTGETRRDDVMQLYLSAERHVASRVSVYAQVMGVHQWSNVEELAYGQARGVVGVRVELGRAGSEDGSAIWPAQAAVMHPLGPVVGPAGVTFRVQAAGAKHVAVVGGFNGWDPRRSELHGPDPSGVWEATLPLPAGTWRYAFVVDGKWVRPEGAPRYEESDFGTENGVLDLEEPDGEAPGEGTGSP